MGQTCRRFLSIFIVNLSEVNAHHRIQAFLSAHPVIFTAHPDGLIPIMESLQRAVQRCESTTTQQVSEIQGLNKQGDVSFLRLRRWCTQGHKHRKTIPSLTLTSKRIHCFKRIYHSWGAQPGFYWILTRPLFSGVNRNNLPFIYSLRQLCGSEHTEWNSEINAFFVAKTSPSILRVACAIECTSTTWETKKSSGTS
jgi:hypothetical protein